MVSPSKPNHSRVASQHHLRKLCGSHASNEQFESISNYFLPPIFVFFLDKCKLVKGPKPLIHFKFYLDIEKHHIENKIEKTIRELGGVSDTKLSNYEILFVK